MPRPENPTCAAEVRYWFDEVARGAQEEGAEKAEQKLRCYYHHCSTRAPEDRIEFKWCCKNAPREYGRCTDVGMAQLLQEIAASPLMAKTSP